MLSRPDMRSAHSKPGGNCSAVYITPPQPSKGNQIPSGSAAHLVADGAAVRLAQALQDLAQRAHLGAAVQGQLGAHHETGCAGEGEISRRHENTQQSTETVGTIRARGEGQQREKQ